VFLSAQPAHFSFAGVGLASDFKTVAARYPRSVAQDQYVSLAPEDVHDHVTAIEISGSGGNRRVRIAFELSLPNAERDYPSCDSIEARLVADFGRPTTTRRFYEERVRRADRVWQSPNEEMQLICFEGPRRQMLAEAVQIYPR
jgi:hypothetical protein